MSRSGYDEGCDGPELFMWRGAVASAIKGQRGQTFLQHMAAALDAMPVKRLVTDELITREGEVCALGAVAKARDLDTHLIDPEDSDNVAALFNIAPAMAREIAYENDEATWYNETPEERWKRMRKWVDENLVKA